MTNSKFIYRVAAGISVLACCVSCVVTDETLGSNLIPIEQTYKFYTERIPIDQIEVRMADSLSGYSSSRLVIGAVSDEDYGMTTRSSAITLVPLFNDSLEIGRNPEFKNFRFAIGRDTLSSNSEDQLRILQNINVYELDRALDASKDYDCNKPLQPSANKVAEGTPIYNGGDSLVFYFTKEYGEKFLSLKPEDFKDFETYTGKFPGIYLDTDLPAGDGGRIDLFSLQLGYDVDYYYLTGNFAKLNYSAEFDGERKDTCVYFYYGASDFYNTDSLLTSTTTGNYPQYALNLTSQQTEDREGYATDKIYFEGGGGLKPVVRAEHLIELAQQAIASKGADPEQVVINKASLVFPFEFPADYLDMTYWPQILSPTCKLVTEDEENGEKVATFMGLTDSSSSDENQGDVNRSILNYAPDITYHMQELLKIDRDDLENARTQNLLRGEYDIWLLIMANEQITTTTSGNQDLSDMYNYLAYQSYYNSMYGGGYYGYGYGGYGSYYSNYYNYSMMAAYAASSSTSTSNVVMLDKDRFYKAELNGPESTTGRVPVLELTFAVPNGE